MKRSLAYSTLAATLLTVMALAQAAPASAASPAIAWRSDVLTAYCQAMGQRKPLVICFVGEDANGMFPNCRKLLREVFAGPELTAYADRAVFVLANSALVDAHPNVKKLMSDLNIKDFPTVAVLQCMPEKIYASGEIVGPYETAEYIKLFAKLHADCVAKIAIASPPLTPEQEADQARDVRRKIGETSAISVKAGQDYRRVLNNLMVSGPVDVQGFTRAYDGVVQGYGDFAATLRELASLPSPEANALAVQMLDYLTWEARLGDGMHSELCDLIERTRLADDASREKVQSLVLNTEQAATHEFEKRAPALGELAAKFLAHYGLE